MGAGGAALLVNMPSPSTVLERASGQPAVRCARLRAPLTEGLRRMSIKDLVVSCGALIAGVVVAWIAVVTVI